MRYYQLQRSGESVLAVEAESVGYDLTSARSDLDSFEVLVRAAGITGQRPDDITARLLADADEIPVTTLEDRGELPVSVDEVWAAGVTYRISEEARTEESDMPDIYVDVYDADRPEIFFKATPERTVGPDEAIGVRGDSDWNVPEPELGVVLYRGETVGYTIGNDVSSRAIEGANPLYLPQAKVYDRCCALGPCLATGVSDPHDLAISMRITREGDTVYDESTSTAEMVRTCEELVSYLARHNPLPEVTALLTGTSLVPEDEFTLRPDDRVTIDIEGIGTLSNPVVSV
jgi:2-dehydro-3-deoxy-D-arabinonate dehydratase